MPSLTLWEKRSEWPLTAVAIVFLIAYAIPIVDPSSSYSVRDACENLMNAAWVIFATDYVIRLCLAGAGSRVAFMKSNVLDLAVVLLPLLRPLRLIRLLALVSILNRTGVHRLRGRVITYAVGGTVMLVTLGALAVTDAEAGANDAHIRSVWDGLWWALTTITTIGYGDTYPVTPTGRLVAASLMVGGVALLGVVTGTFASWLVERMSEAAEVEQAATREQVELLHRELKEIRLALERLAPTDQAGPEHGST